MSAEYLEQRVAAAMAAFDLAVVTAEQAAARQINERKSVALSYERETVKRCRELIRQAILQGEGEAK